MKLIIAILFFPLMVNAQKVIKLDSIGLIAIDTIGMHHSIDYYKQINKEYRLADFDLTLNNERKDFKFIIDYDDPLALSKIQKKDKLILYLEDIKSMRLDKLLLNFFSKEWILNSKNNKLGKDERYVFSKYNKYIFKIKDEVYATNTNHEFGGGRRCLIKSDNMKMWRERSADYFQYFIIDLGNNKYIIHFVQEDFEGFIIPTLKRYWISFSNFNFESSKVVNHLSNKSRVIPTDELEKLYHIKSSSNKYFLETTLGERIFKNNFDSIYINENFIVTQNNNTYQFYDPQFNLLSIDNIKAFHFYNEYIQVLQKSKLKLFDNKGNRPQTSSCIFFTSLAGCGSYVPYTSSLTLKKPNIKSDFYNLIYTTKKMMNSTILESKNFVLSNFDHSYDVTFLDDKESDKLIVGKNKQLGMYSYDKVLLYDYKLDTLSNTLSKVTEPNSTLQLKEELPISYDSIWVTDKLIYFRKNNLTGIFPLNKQPKYLKIGNRNIHFIFFTLPNSKSGWLDLKTGVEYLVE